MATGIKFDQFTSGGDVKQGDIVVGLRNSTNVQFTFPGEGIKDANGHYILKYQSNTSGSTNYPLLISQSAGEGVILSAEGTNDDIDINIKPLGSATSLLWGSGASAIKFVNSDNENLVVTHDLTLLTDERVVAWPDEAGTVTIIDANGNISVNNANLGYNVTTTSGGTLTLTVASAPLQRFVGSMTETVTMPIVSTLQLGQSYLLVNSSIGDVTVNSSGGDLIQVMESGSRMELMCISLTGTTAASWTVKYLGSTLPATDITYTYPGGVQETLQARLQNYVSVKDFGAKGDGVTDDYLAIQSALDTASAKTLKLPAGTYLTSQTLTFSKVAQILFGDGFGNTIIASTNPGIPAIEVPELAYWAILDLQVIKHSSARPATEGGDGIYVSGIASQAVISNTFCQYNDKGYHLGVTNYSYMFNNYAFNNQDHGLFVHHGAMEGPFQWSINRFLSQLNGGKGYYFLADNGPASMGDITGASTYHNLSDGFVVENSTPSDLIAGVRIYDSFFGGDEGDLFKLDSNGPYLHVLSNVYCEAANGGNGFNLAAGNGPVILNNCTAILNELNGIVSETESLTINGGYVNQNNAHHLPGISHGILISAGEAIIDNCQVINNNGYGIYLSNDGHIICNNIIEDNASGDIGSAAPLVTSQIFGNQSSTSTLTNNIIGATTIRGPNTGILTLTDVASSTHSVKLDTSLINTARTIKFPNKSGTFALLDDVGNLVVNNLIVDYTQTTTDGGTLALDVASTGIQHLVGSTTETVVMPDVTTLELGQSYLIINSSSGDVTVESFGLNVIQVMGMNTRLELTCVSLTGTGVASWSTRYSPLSVGSVTSVAMTVPSFLSVSGSPITTSGTLAVSLSGTALPVANGGTGLTSTTANQLLYSSGSNTIAGLATGNDGVLVTSAGGVPSISSTLPTAVQNSISASNLSNGVTGSGAIVLANTPTLITPILGAATGTSLNLSGLTISQAVVTDGSKNLASLEYTSANTVSTIVSRDGSGNFSAGTITASLSGNATTSTSSTTTTNIANGSANQIPYQTGSGATSFISAAANSVLVTNGSNVPSLSTTLPTNIAMTTPKITTSIKDTNGVSILTFTPAATPVNNIEIQNSGAGAPPRISAVGTDTNIQTRYQSKGNLGHWFYGGTTGVQVWLNLANGAQFLQHDISTVTTGRIITWPDAAGTIVLTPGSTSITTLGTITTGTWTGTTIAVANGGTGQTTLTNLPLTTPKITTGIKDVNGVTIIGFTPSTTPVNYVDIANADTGTAVTVAAKGSNSDVGLNVSSKGFGDLTLSSGSSVGIKFMDSSNPSRVLVHDVAELAAQQNVTWTNTSGVVGLFNFTSRATSAGTTTLTKSSTRIQYFTGSTTETVALPVVSTLYPGYTYLIGNQSSGNVTVQSSGANTLATLTNLQILTAICISVSGTGTASWSWFVSTLGG